MSDDTRRDDAGVEADLAAELEELEREFAAHEDQPADGAGDGRSDSTVGGVGVEPPAARLEPSDLEFECRLAWGEFWRWYADRLGLDDADVDDELLRTDENASRLASVAAPVLNKWLPRISGRFEEELKFVGVVAIAGYSTASRLHARAPEPPENDEPVGEAEGGAGD